MKHALLGALLLALAGCSSIPDGTQVEFPAVPAEKSPQRLVVVVEDPAPAGVGADRELDRQLNLASVISARELRNALQERLTDYFEPGALTIERAKDVPDVEALALERRAGLVARLKLDDVRISFDGHNGWWIPNIFNWFFWIVPSYFVATEEWAIEYVTEVRVEGAASGMPVLQERRDGRVAGSFDELDRGWRPLGFIVTPDDADAYEAVGRQFRQEVQARFGQRVSEALAERLLSKLAEGGADEARRKPLALVVTVGSHRSQLSLPELNEVPRDASRLRRALEASLSADQRLELNGRDATSTALTALEGALRRLADPDGIDDVLIYFSGYGGRGEQGQRVVYLADGPRSVLDWARELAEKIPANKLLVLDCAFDREAGARAAAPLNEDQPSDDLSDQEFGDQVAEALGGSVLLAASGQGRQFTLLEQDGESASLLTYYFCAALSPAADTNSDGSLSAGELFDFVGERVAADAAYLGRRQEVLLATQGPFRLPLNPDGEAK